MSGVSGTYEIMAPVTTTPSTTEVRRISRRAAAVVALGHARRGCEGEGAEGGGGARDRLRRGRARLPDAGAHRRGRRRGLPGPGQPPLHADRGHPGPARGDRGQDQARLRLRGGCRPGARDQRRQAGRRQRVRRPVRPRRRGHRARPVLDDLPRVDRARRRDAGRRELRRDDRLPQLGRRPRGGVDAQHQGVVVRVAVQPDRRGVPARGDRGHRPLGRGQGDLGASPTRSTST